MYIQLFENIYNVKNHISNNFNNPKYQDPNHPDPNVRLKTLPFSLSII